MDWWFGGWIDGWMDGRMDAMGLLIRLSRWFKEKKMQRSLLSQSREVPMSMKCSRLYRRSLRIYEGV